ncbi:DUF58 domain-containing protein [bacterium]|nr:DUF58 domain-containing protein [bacterium]PIV80767.1 MAG: DUF58 domain-containing protein [bacterium CG17_big_fil_post_rev_8_21_14_2_50_64_8]PJA73729.1 MAG: DUF58 domain-containing protein [bacterium CG_4_9_14_3_um_filter_65_15]
MSDPLLSPETIGSLGRLDLIARLMVEGFLMGLHRSPYHGFSAEFAEYRQYIPGEPVNNIDWRLFAKTDRHYLKVFAEETNLRATILVDCSASMSYRSDPKLPLKRTYAAWLAAALSYLLLRQNDAVGLVTFDEQPLERVPARSMRRQLFQVLKVLEHLPDGHGTRLGPVLHNVAERIPRRGLVILLSDMMDDPAAVLDGLKHFRHRGHEVLVFQVLDPREVDLKFSGEVEFEALEEPGRRVRLEPAHMGADYRRGFEAWRDDLRRECRRRLVDMVEMTTSTAFAPALAAYLQKRRRMS